jgi:hypothetical protein
MGDCHSYFDSYGQVNVDSPQWIDQVNRCACFPDVLPMTDASRLRAPRSVDELFLYRLMRLTSTARPLVVRLCEREFGITRREWSVLGLLAQHNGLSPCGAAADRVAACGGDAGCARGDRRDGGIGGADPQRDHPGGGGCGHRLRHDRRAHFACAPKTCRTSSAACARRSRSPCRTGVRATAVAATRERGTSRRAPRCRPGPGWRRTSSACASCTRA